MNQVKVIRNIGNLLENMSTDDTRFPELYQATFQVLVSHGVDNDLAKKYLDLKLETMSMPRIDYSSDYALDIPFKYQVDEELEKLEEFIAESMQDNKSRW